MSVSLDTSAALKLLVEEAESAALAAALDALGPLDRLVSAWLLHTELHCAVARRAALLGVAGVDAVLGRILLVDLERADLLAPPRDFPGLRTPDAIHLAVAGRIGAASVVTHDAEQAAAAERAGLRVLQPG